MRAAPIRVQQQVYLPVKLVARGLRIAIRRLAAHSPFANKTKKKRRPPSNHIEDKRSSRKRLGLKIPSHFISSRQIPSCLPFETYRISALPAPRRRPRHSTAPHGRAITREPTATTAKCNTSFFRLPVTLLNARLAGVAGEK